MNEMVNLIKIFANTLWNSSICMFIYYVVSTITVPNRVIINLKIK